MNALVSDQLGRLRKMIGNSTDGFHGFACGISSPKADSPQFGMYTGEHLAQEYQMNNRIAVWLKPWKKIFYYSQRK